MTSLVYSRTKGGVYLLAPVGQAKPLISMLDRSGIEVTISNTVGGRSLMRLHRATEETPDLIELWLQTTPSPPVDKIETSEATVWFFAAT